MTKPLSLKQRAKKWADNYYSSVSELVWKRPLTIKGALDKAFVTGYKAGRRERERHA